MLYVLQFDAQGNRTLRVTKVQNNKQMGVFCLTPLYQQYFSYIVAVSFIGGGCRR